MPIQEQNIVFVRHQVMDDVPEGGGAATGVQIIDGQMNNVFEDVSDLDRAYGRFNLRKVSVAVRTLSTDLFAGAKTVFTALPLDPAIGYTVFTTPDPFDTRTQAANRVEAYLFKGPMWHGALWENHIQGMRTINILQRINTLPPVIGKTLCLVQGEGTQNQREQYIRVTGVQVTERTFTDSSGDYYRWQVTLELSDALRFDFTGHVANRMDNYNYTTGARLRDTSVADATRYYGAQALAQPAGLGDLTVRAASIYSQLVPSAQTETPLVNRPLAGDRIPMLPTAADPITYNAPGAAIAPGGRFVLRTGSYPGTLSVTVGAVTYTDDAAGNAVRGGVVIGRIDYAAGETLFNASAPTASGTASITYLPATAAPQQAHTRAIPVTVENRRLNWIETLSPLPAAGSMEFSYMAQGNWYTLRADQSGNVTGTDPAYGVGLISAVTGVMQITLASLPDVGSQIMITWASPVHYTILAGGTADAAAELELRYTLAHAPVVPGTWTGTYPVGGTSRSATADTNGHITGTGVTGTIDHATGNVTLRFTAPPDRNTALANAYTWRDGADLYSGTAATLSGGQFTVPGTAPFRNGGTMTLAVSGGPGGVPAYITSGGQLRVKAGKHLPAGWTGNPYEWADQQVGVFNAATGVATLTGTIAAGRKEWRTTGTENGWLTGGWELHGTTYTITGVADIKIERDTAAFDPNAITAEQISPSEIGLTLDLTATTIDALVTGSVLASITGAIIIDRAGTLYANPDPATGTALTAGRIDYTTGLATLNWWQDATAAAPAVLACLARYGNWTATDCAWRTPVAPLKPESLSITAVTADGDTITATADADGLITGPWIRGNVNYEYGTARAEFGRMESGTWEPRHVDPGSIRYNAVAYSYLPLDANILGIDPVRLPPDGRVPIYRKGDLALITHAATNAPATPTLVIDGAEQWYELPCGRTRIGWVRITDANGQPLTTGYDLDRATGLIKFPTLAGIATPLTVRHTVADLRMITDVQINGTLTLARPLSHNYPAGESIVSSCLIHGDRRARVSAVWDQATWGTPQWSDAIVGDPATATLNTIDHPITVTNEGCDTDRWVLRCTNAATHAWELISEKRGLVWSGTYAPGGANIAPINPRTRGADGQGGTPYMIIPGAANGGGWATGNIVRINTVGAIAHMWIARAIKQSDEPMDDGADGCELYCLGNIDRP